MRCTYISILIAAGLIACHGSTRGSGGAGSGAGAQTTGGGAAGATTDATAQTGTSTDASTSGESSSTGVMMTCTIDMKCDLPAGETCGVCADCVVGTPACGGCMTNGVCDQSDACTCLDCRSDKTVCPEVQCEIDGICDYYTENCTCADCISDPACL